MPVSIDSLLLRKMRVGNSYIVSETKSVSSGGSFTLHVENPQSSDFSYVVYGANVSATDATTGHVHDKFDSISPGVAADVHSSEASTRNDTDANAYTDTTYTANGTHSHITVGSSGGISMGGDEGLPNLVLTPGTDMVIHADNVSANTSEIVITVILIEISS